jgi:hypothetical protein
VLQVPTVTPRGAGRDEAFIAAVRDEFPNVLNRSMLPVEAPPTTPHITLASTSSQLAVSSMQADFEVRFYGDYLTDIGMGLEYVERKLNAMLAGFAAVETPASMIGLIATLHFSFEDVEGDDTPAAHILRTHLRSTIQPDEVQDALARVAVKLRDTYFVTLTLSNYETRTLERPLMPGMPAIRIRPWEGRVDDVGLELSIDINNNLEARVRREDPVVRTDGIRAVTGVLREIATDSGPEYAKTGAVSAETLELSSSQ